MTMDELRCSAGEPRPPAGGVFGTVLRGSKAFSFSSWGSVVADDVECGTCFAVIGAAPQMRLFVLRAALPRMSACICLRVPRCHIVRPPAVLAHQPSGLLLTQF